MKKTELVSAGNELNALLFAEDNPQIDIKGGAPEMKANIYESLKLLEPTDTLTKETIATILECDFAFDDGYFAEGVEKKDVLLTSLEKLGIWVNEPTQDDAPADDDLATEVQNAPTLQELKKIAKANEEFKSIRSKLTKYDDVDELIADMLALLDGGPEDAEVVEEEKEKETIEHPASKKKAVKPVKKGEKEEEEDDLEGIKQGSQILVLRDNARAELAQIQTIEDGIDYLHKVKSIETWVKAEKKDAELQNIVAEQKLRTQRILGELIKKGQEEGSLATQKEHGKGIQKTSVLAEDTRRTLDEIGITRNQSSTFKQIASIPQKEFDSFVNEKKQAVKEATDELTTRGSLAFAKQLSKSANTEPKEKEKLENESELIVLAGQITEKYDRFERQYLISLIK